MGARARHVCPICGRDVPPRHGTPENSSYPFCSPSCKLVDLGRWLDGAYRVAVPDEGEASSQNGETAPRASDGSDEE